MIFEVSKITDKIIRFHFETAEQLCRHFIRFQEHYESPDLRGQIFTLGQIKAAYTKRFGAFTYYDDWTGMNVPSSIFKPFLEGLFDPLTPEEVNILDVIRYKQGQFYVIGTSEESRDSTFDHEICHALFHVNDEYRLRVLCELDFRIKELQPLYHVLRTKGYCEEVIADEAHAYICTGSDYLDEKQIFYPKELVYNLKKLKEFYFQLEKSQ